MVIIIIKTRLFIVTLFLLVLISMAGVSAAADANDIVANGENVEVIASDSSLHEDLSADVTLQNEVSGSSDDEGLPVLNDDDDDNGPATNYTLVGSFSDLAKAINNSDGKLVLDKDYVFNPETDGEYAAEGISIERHNFIIDGQNHTLDGIGKFFRQRKAVLRAAALSVPESDECIRRQSHLGIPYRSGSLAVGIPVGRFSVNGKALFTGIAFTQ